MTEHNRQIQLIADSYEQEKENALRELKEK